MTIDRVSRAALAAVAVLLAFVPQARADAWSNSYDPATKTRFIPLELWTGGAWDGTRAITLVPADVDKRNPPRSIAGKSGRTVMTDGGSERLWGPVDASDPLTGGMLKVYHRHSERGKSGTVKQVFMLRDDGAGVGRIEDSRFDSFYRGEAKFPLGIWKDGEVRVFEIASYSTKTNRPSPVPSAVTIIIERIDHRFEGAEHCLTYRWQKTVRDKMVDNNAYTYCPLKGRVSLDDD